MFAVLLLISSLFRVSFQCLATVPDTTTTVVPTPACAMCPLNSFYDEDFCPTYETDGCVAIPVAEAVTTTTTAAGCLESTLTCPEGSYAYLRSGTIESEEVASATELQALINPIFCSDDSSWLFQNAEIDNNAPMDQLVCYYKACSRCAENIATDVGCLDGYTCTSPTLIYSTDPAACKTFTVMVCTESIYVSFTDSTQAIITQAELISDVTFACSNTAQWIATFTDATRPTRTVSTIRCANTV